MSETVGFIGLGNMGLPMALRLAERGWKLRAYNRTPEKAEPLVHRGAVRVDRPGDAAEPGGIVISMLADDRAVEEIFSSKTNLLSRMGTGGVHLSMSTIHPETARRLAAEHRQAGVTYIAAPVFGRPDAAGAGELWVVTSGEEAARRRAEPIFAALGRGTFQFGSDPGAANVAKLCGNFLIAASIEAIGETAALAEKSGVDPQSLVEMLTTTLFNCPVYQGYGRRIVSRKFLPAGFPLTLGLKDVELALAAARSVQMPMPFASLLRDRSLAAINKGRSAWDWASLSLEAVEEAGLSAKSAAG